MGVAWMMDVTLKVSHSQSSVVLLSPGPFGLCQTFQSAFNSKYVTTLHSSKQKCWITIWEYREVYLKEKLTNQRCWGG
jgi:hypothetical protein